MIRAAFAFILLYSLIFPASVQAWEAFFLKAVKSDTMLVTPRHEKTGRIVEVQLYGIDASALEKKGPEAVQLAFQKYVRKGDVVTIIPMQQHSVYYEISLVIHGDLVLNMEWPRRQWAKIQDVVSCSQRMEFFDARRILQ